MSRIVLRWTESVEATADLTPEQAREFVNKFTDPELPEDATPAQILEAIEEMGDIENALAEVDATAWDVDRSFESVWIEEGKA